MTNCVKGEIESSAKTLKIQQLASSQTTTIQWERQSRRFQFVIETIINNQVKTRLHKTLLLRATSTVCNSPTEPRWTTGPFWMHPAEKPCYHVHLCAHTSFIWGMNEVCINEATEDTTVGIYVFKQHASDEPEDVGVVLESIKGIVHPKKSKYCH